jgi:hypothetical protein
MDIIENQLEEMKKDQELQLKILKAQYSYYKEYRELIHQMWEEL